MRHFGPLGTLWDIGRRDNASRKQNEMAGMKPAMTEIRAACGIYFSAATTGPRPISCARPCAVCIWCSSKVLTSGRRCSGRPVDGRAVERNLQSDLRAASDTTRTTRTEPWTGTVSTSPMRRRAWALSVGWRLIRIEPRVTSAAQSAALPHEPRAPQPLVQALPVVVLGLRYGVLPQRFSAARAANGPCA